MFFGQVQEVGGCADVEYDRSVQVRQAVDEALGRSRHDERIKAESNLYDTISCELQIFECFQRGILHPDLSWLNDGNFGILPLKPPVHHLGEDDGPAPSSTRKLSA